MAQRASTAPATLEQAQEMGLRPEEFDLIKEILGRTPNFTEMCIYSVMWSEHCSYKNSIKWLKTLPKDGPHLLVKAGEENAGIVDIGDGVGCAFKIESHNHPSALEPYQGAATGVGGINRDIFTMGARPIAQLNLRFGDLENPKTKWLLDGVVRGIGDYGTAWRADRGRGSLLRPGVPGQSARQRDEREPGRQQPHHQRQSRWPGQPGLHPSDPPLERMASRGPRLRPRTSLRTARVRPAGRAGGRPVPGEAAP